jgi:hypothetical protein
MTHHHHTEQLAAHATTPVLHRLASLLQEVADDPKLRNIAAYAGALAELAAMHDAVAKLPKGSPENRAAFAATRKSWDAARVFAAKHGLQHPTAALREMGYSV